MSDLTDKDLSALARLLKKALAALSRVPAIPDPMIHSVESLCYAATRVERELESRGTEGACVLPIRFHLQR